MDKRTALAFGLIVLVIILLPYYYKAVLPPEQKPQLETEQLEQPSSDTLGTPLQSETIEKQVDTLEAETAEVRPESGDFFLEENPEFVTVTTPFYEMVFSTRGGVMVKCRLLEYEGQDDGKVQLIRPESRENLNLTLYRNGHLLDMRNVRFKPDKKQLFIPAEGEGRLVLRAEDPGGGWLQKTLTFRGDEYPFRMRLEAGGIEDLDPFYEVHWGSGLAITEPDTAQDIYYAKAYAYMGGELETFKGKGDKDISGRANGTTEWIALRNKYFEVAILPVTRPGEGVQFGMDAQPMMGKFRPKVFRAALNMSGRLDREIADFTVYCGPLDQKLITRVLPTLASTMNWGWKVIEPFSKLVLWALRSLHSFIPNYGLVLILFSVLVKIVVWPLTYKSTRSMSRMSAVQPKIKELQEKYKGNPEKINKAMMQLYKEEGVNPFSSCWPTLLQMPLLYALFIIFRSTIELRKAPFILWIKDLSMPDVVAHLPFSLPLYGAHIALLPIFMGVTQLLMSKVMITDPKQKATMYMMPIFMVLIFNNFPSGLSLYYALFNLWTYLQQTWLKQKGVIPGAKPSKA